MGALCIGQTARPHAGRRGDLGAGVEANIRKFRAFVTSARLGSFTRAAEDLGCTQSTVSRMVASLEADWQLRLFHRRGTALVLTSDGEAVLEDADRLCRSYDDLLRHVESLRGLSSGSIAIAAPSSIVALRLAKPLGAFVRSHPGVQVNIVESTYGEAQSLMEKDAVDFAFVPRHMQAEGLECTLFERDELVIVAPRGHFAQPGAIPVESLLDEMFVADTETAPLLQRELRHSNVRCVTSNTTAILAMVEAGLGISLLPSLALEGSDTSLDVRHLETPAWRSMYLVHHHASDLSVAARAFLAAL